MSPAVEARAGAGAAASEVVQTPESLDPPWPPKCPASPWVPEWAPDWRPSVWSPCPLRPPEQYSTNSNE